MRKAESNTLQTVSGRSWKNNNSSIRSAELQSDTSRQVNGSRGFMWPSGNFADLCVCAKQVSSPISLQKCFALRPEDPRRRKECPALTKPLSALERWRYGRAARPVRIGGTDFSLCFL